MESWRNRKTLILSRTDMMGLLTPAEYNACVERPSYEDVLAGLDVSALIVVGHEDTFTTRKDAERMHALLKRSELVWMAGVGHMPNLESTAEFNAALERLLGAVTMAV
jgi:pimeloyl-ACP methyl ester carboxylesterase